MPSWRRWEKPFDIGDDVVQELWPERAIEGEHLDLDAQFGAGAGGRLGQPGFDLIDADQKRIHGNHAPARA